MLPEHERHYYDKMLDEQHQTIKVLEKRLYEWQKAYNVIYNELYNSVVKVFPPPSSGSGVSVYPGYVFRFYEKEDRFDTLEEGLKWSMDEFDHMYPKP